MPSTPTTPATSPRPKRLTGRLYLEPSRSLAHYQLGVIEAGKGQNDAAIAHFEKFLELAPTDPQAEPTKRAIETLKQNKTQG